MAREPAGRFCTRCGRPLLPSATPEERGSSLGSPDPDGRDEVSASRRTGGNRPSADSAARGPPLPVAARSTHPGAGAAACTGTTPEVPAPAAGAGAAAGSMTGMFAFPAVFAAVPGLVRGGCCGGVYPRRRVRQLASTPRVSLCHDCARSSARMTARKRG